MLEKERKFKLKYLPKGLEPKHIKQGYLMFEGKKHLRVRITDNKLAELTFKTILDKEVKKEFEYQIPLKDAKDMYNDTKIWIEKIRYSTKFGKNKVDIDFYLNGIQVVEIEFNSPLKKLPDYCGEEVTGQAKYSNIVMALRNKNKTKNAI